MRLTFKYVLETQKNKEEILNDLFWHTTKVYNILLYDILNGNKKELEENINKTTLNILSSKIYKKYRKENWHSKYLHSHTLLNVIKNVIQNYKSYINLKSLYEKNKSCLKGVPKNPRYKGKSQIQEIIFTKYAIRIRGNKILLSLSKEMQTKYKVESLNFLISNKLKKLICFEEVKEIKVQIKNGKYILYIVYEKKEKTNDKLSNIMAIDIGLANLVACTNKDNSNTLLVSGKALKSRNKYLNEKISKLQKIEMIKLKENSKYKATKNIKRLFSKRDNYINTYLHKVSRLAITYALENDCKLIVIGQLKGIKYKMKNNKNFVQIPITRLVKMIKYKAKLEGIEVKYITEEYTSGVSSLDKEEVTKANYNKKRRIKRGLFKTNENKLINADINGSLNILRKYLKNSSPNQEIAMDKGREQRPIKTNVA